MHHLTEREITLTIGLVPIASIVIAAIIADIQSNKRKKIEVKRIAYAELLTSIENIADYVENLIDDSKGLKQAYASMNSALAMMDLIAPKIIHEKATDAFRISQISRTSESQEEIEERKNYLNELTSLMRKDLGFESDDVVQEA